MTRQNVFSLIVISFVSVIFLSCQKEISRKKQQEEFSTSNAANQQGLGKLKKIYVTNIDELYAAINDPDNDGTTIVLAPSTYMLSPAYPNGGRLELLHDMTLTGQAGRQELVIIDVSNLPNASYVLGPGRRTGAIRTGNGNNTIEWMTVQNTVGIINNIRSLIQTDITATPITRVKIAHCILKGSSIGLSIINREPANNSRIVEAEIENNEIINNNVLPFGSGIQIQNSSVIENAVIRASLRNNKIMGNKAGMLAFNASSKNCLMEINSYNDRIENNGMGLMFNGGFCEIATSPTLSNSLKFEAYAIAIQNNNGNPAPPFLFPAVGVYATGGDAFPPFAPPGTAHYNNLDVKFNGYTIEGNAGTSQIIGYGGHSFHPSLTPIGTYNSTKIYLQRLSNNVSVSATASFPAEPAGTNTIAVYQ